MNFKSFAQAHSFSKVKGFSPFHVPQSQGLPTVAFSTLPCASLPGQDQGAAGGGVPWGDVGLLGLHLPGAGAEAGV